MSESKIEWTGRSDWNPVRGCTRVSPGCGGPGPHGGCYAEAMAARFSKPGMWGHGFAEMVDHKPRWTGKVELQEDRLTIPLSWRKPGFVFPNSTSDFFHEALGVHAICRIFAVMAMCPHLTFQVLTKRAERMRTILGHSEVRNEVELAAERIKPSVGTPFSPKYSFAWPLPNVWLGVSTERQQEADERIPHLLQTPAAVRFISAEPLLGPIDLQHLALPKDWERCTCTEHTPGLNAFGASIYCEGCCEGAEALDLQRLDWVIVGGESGPGARPMHPDWARSLRNQCLDEEVPIFFKQWGRYAPQHNDPMEAYFASLKNGEPDHHVDKGFCFGRSPSQRPWMMFDLGKKSAGRLLDGIEHNAMPKVTA